jgi:hypothetical protein
LADDGLDLREEILFEDAYYSQRVDAEWDKLVALREPNWKKEPMLQCWYSDEHSVVCMAQTNQPYRLP